MLMFAVYAGQAWFSVCEHNDLLMGHQPSHKQPHEEQACEVSREAPNFTPKVTALRFYLIPNF